MQANKFESENFQREKNPTNFLMKSIEAKMAVGSIIDQINKNKNKIDFKYLNDKGNTFLHEFFTEKSEFNLREILRQGYRKSDLLELIPYLLGKVDINVKNNNGETVMDLVIDDRFEFIELLLLNGAEIEETRRKKEIINKLEYYFFSEYNETVGRIFKLLPLKILEEIVGQQYGLTGIHEALTSSAVMSLLSVIPRKHLDIVELLIEKGAQVDKVITRDGVITPLLMAIKRGHLGIVKLLIEKGAQIDQATTSDDVTTPLLMAVERGHLDIVELLIEKGAQIDQANADDDVTPLLMATERGHLDIVKLLIEKGAQVNQARTSDGATPLLIFIERGHLDIVKLLIEKGAQVNQARTSDGITPLLMAIEHRHFGIVKLLIEKGAQVNQTRTKNGGSPLFFAAQNGYAEVVELLIQNGAETNVKCSTAKETLKRVVERNGQKGAKERLTNYLISQGLQRLIFLNPVDSQVKLEITLFDLLTIIGHKEIIAILESKKERERIVSNSSFQNN